MCTLPGTSFRSDACYCAGITHIGGGSVLSLRLSEEGVFRVEIAVLDESGAAVLRVETVHEVVTCCGYRPDMSISEELQVCNIACHFAACSLYCIHVL